MGTKLMTYPIHAIYHIYNNMYTHYAYNNKMIHRHCYYFTTHLLSSSILNIVYSKVYYIQS